jgi:hypothetical protein
VNEPERDKKSPLDARGIDLGISRHETIQAIGAGRGNAE